MMIYLLAETPRAGIYNHRFLTSDNCDLTESQISEIINIARLRPQGEWYISVNKDMSQKFSGRIGNEIIVLLGINIKELSDMQKLQIKEFLFSLFDNITNLLNSIDWELEGKNIVVRREEFQSWIFNPILLKLPTTEIFPEKRKFENKRARRSVFLTRNNIYFIIVVLILIFIISPEQNWWYSKRINNSNVSSVSNVNNNKIIHKKEFQISEFQKNKNKFILIVDKTASHDCKDATQEFVECLNYLPKNEKIKEFKKYDELFSENNDNYKALDNLSDKFPNDFDDLFFLLDDKMGNEFKNKIDISRILDKGDGDTLGNDFDFSKVVKIRNKIRKYHSILIEKNGGGDLLCLPFFTKDDVDYVIRLGKNIQDIYGFTEPDIPLDEMIYKIYYEYSPNEANLSVKKYLDIIQTEKEKNINREKIESFYNAVMKDGYNDDLLLIYR